MQANVEDHLREEGHAHAKRRSRRRKENPEWRRTQDRMVQEIAPHVLNAPLAAREAEQAIDDYLAILRRDLLNFAKDSHPL